MLARTYISYDFNQEDKDKIRILFIENSCQNYSDLIPHEVEFVHSTIEFIGEIEINQAVKIKSIIKNINIEDITLKITGKILQLGFEKKYLALEIENNSKLMGIYNEVISILNKFNIKPKNKEYLPHISLGRILINNNTNIYMEIKPKSITVFRSVDYSKEI